MAEQILQYFLDDMPDEVRVRRATSPGNQEGVEPYEDEPGTTYRCKVSGITVVENGSTRHKLKATVGTTDALKNEDMYILPVRYEPNIFYGGVQVKPVTDENGIHHHVVYFG